jgi:hypothetical protein
VARQKAESLSGNNIFVTKTKYLVQKHKREEIILQLKRDTHSLPRLEEQRRKVGPGGLCTSSLSFTPLALATSWNTLGKL